MKQRAWISAMGCVWGRVGCAIGLCASVASAQEPPTEPPSEPAPPPPAPAQPPPLLSDEAWAELEAYTESALVAFDVPGAALALIQDGQIQRVGTFGVLGVDDPAPVDEETRFMIGSVTKSMTTTLAATLVSEGRLEWDDPVSDYLPSFALSNSDWTPLVRIRDALGHTSGVPRSDLSLFIDFHRPMGLIESVADIPAVTAPGERFEYQNQVFAVGGFALARAAGARNRNDDLASTYERLMQRRVFNPLRMRRTTFDFQAAIRDDNHAFPHAMDAATAGAGSIAIGHERFALPVAPAGAVWSSITDMARYLAMHLREGVSVDGARLVSASALEETHTAQTVLEGSTGYGLGWGVSEGPLGKVLAHGGGTAGFISQVVGAPSVDYGWVILTNSIDGIRLVSAVGRHLSELVFGLPPQGDADLVAAHAEQEAGLAQFLSTLAPVDADSVADYLGRYERRLTLSHEADELVVGTVYGELRFKAVPEQEGLFFCTTNFLLGAPAQLATDEQGRAKFSIGFGVENGALVNPIIAARLGDERPRHPGHPHGKPHGKPHGVAAAQRAFDWRQLANARRSNDAPDHLEFSRRFSGPGLQ